MRRDEVEDLVRYAIDALVENDGVLLEVNVSERSLSYRLAHYISLSDAIKPPLVVDCEYNRHFGDPKRLRLPSRTARDRELRATTVFPDIVVHERNADNNNVFVLELKKPGESLTYDDLKLRAFVAELGYAHAAHLILGRDTNGETVRELIWVSPA